MVTISTETIIKILNTFINGKIHDLVELELKIFNNYIAVLLGSPKTVLSISFFF